MQAGGYSRHALINFKIQFLPGAKYRQAVIKDPAANRGNTVIENVLYKVTFVYVMITMHMIEVGIP